MASTGSVVYLRPRFTTSAAGTTGSVLFLSSRASTGIYSSLAISQRNSRNRKVIRPIGVPIADPQTGMMNPQWEQFFVYMEKTFLNMLKGPTLPDVASYVTSSQARSIAVSVFQEGLAQQVNANAQSQQAMVEVVKTAALPGSTQIPPVQLVNYKTVDYGLTGGGD